MFPVPRVLKEPSYVEQEVMTECFKNHANRRKYHLRCIHNAPGHARFLLNWDSIAEISSIEDRTILRKLCHLNFCYENAKDDPRIRSREEARSV